MFDESMQYVHSKMIYYIDIKTHGSEWQGQETKKQAYKNKNFNHYCESITRANVFVM